MGTSSHSTMNGLTGFPVGKIRKHVAGGCPVSSDISTSLHRNNVTMNSSCYGGAVDSVLPAHKRLAQRLAVLAHRQDQKRARRHIRAGVQDRTGIESRR